jgi:glycosyltransferase involved in cell wall biosynthesis
MVEALGDEFDFCIVTSDRDATDTVPYPDIEDNAWRKVGKARVLYLSPERKRLLHVAQILRETPYDVLYLNSFFDRDFTLKPLLVRRLGLAPNSRCIIAPRGEFSDGALNLKAAKKKAFLLTARAAGLYKNLIWQASSEHEKAAIHRTLGPIAEEVTVATNLPDMTSLRSNPFAPRKQDDMLRICFLSRISPMKNLDYALEILGSVKASIQFDIYGPIRDEEYWSRCRLMIEELPASVKVTYKGSVENSQVAQILAAYDLFFLPTRGENYGHVIFESLSVGTPVLIADTTPWRGLAEIEVGWELPLENPKGFADKIDQMACLPFDDQIRMRKRAHYFAEQRRNDAGVVQASRSLLLQASR